MSTLNSHDPNFRLLPAETKAASGRKLTPKVWLIAMLTLTLVMGAFYAPVLWEELPINAASRAQSEQVQPIKIDASLLQDQEALAQIYDQIAPSVVSIQVTTKASPETDNFPFPNLPGLPDVPQGEVPQMRGEGSGFIYDSDGHIVTNNHVVQDAETIVVVFNNGEWADGEVVATDPQADLAVVKVTPPSDFTWRVLPLASPDSLKVGHTVIAMGNPFGLENTMTVGIVSALGRGMPVGELGNSTYTLPDVIQTDAAINPGNSGGPMINLAGEVVGVNFAIESASRSNSGVGFTIPVSIVQRVVPALIANGKYDYAYLGLSGTTIGPDVAKALELSNDTLGVYVSTVVPDGPSDKAGIRGADNEVSTNGSNDLQSGGDIITAIDGQPVHRFEDLVSYLVTKTEPGKTIKLSVLRDGQAMDVDVVLGTRPGLNEQTAIQIEGPVTARQAIRIATEAVGDSLNADITERTVSPDTRDGKEVWVVELSTGDQTATVIVSQETGEVLEMSVK